ncbi:Hypothetical predicted protein, partial [Paramuricea clavata]
NMSANKLALVVSRHLACDFFPFIKQIDFLFWILFYTYAVQSCSLIACQLSLLLFALDNFVLKPPI